MVRTGAALSVAFRSNPAAILGATLQTKAVERQIAVVTIIAVKIGAFLAAVAADRPSHQNPRQSRHSCGE
jgi:hypothetical protein